MHRTDDGQHGARGVNGVAALLEHARAREGAGRLARDRDPMPRVEHWLVRAGKRFRRRGEQARDKTKQGNEG